MERRTHRVSCTCLRYWIAAAVLSSSAAALAAPATVTVHAQTIRSHIRAFARVKPITRAVVRTDCDGRLMHMDLVPGSALHAGQRIGDIEGTRVRARLDRDKARLQSARHEEQAFHDTLEEVRQRFTDHLSTHQDVNRAIVALDRAQDQSVAAQLMLRSDRAASVLLAPVSGTVVKVMAHAGERVMAGQVLVVVQPDHALMLDASVYAPQARRQLHIDMRGRFLPDDGSAALPVRVTQLPPRLRPDGAQPVTLARIDPASPNHAWISGETGTVQLEGPPRSRIMLPTRALVLDRGHWWVLLHTAAGDRRRAVVPGPRHGQRTEIVDGLEPGMEVIVDHAYRRFHRDIAHHFRVQD